MTAVAPPPITGSITERSCAPITGTQTISAA
jgi:hypothetical protein